MFSEQQQQDASNNLLLSYSTTNSRIAKNDKHQLQHFTLTTTTIVEQQKPSFTKNHNLLAATTTINENVLNNSYFNNSNSNNNVELKFEKLFDNFVQANSCRQIQKCFECMCKSLRINTQKVFESGHSTSSSTNNTSSQSTTTTRLIYKIIKSKTNYWKANDLWKKYDKRANSKEYELKQETVKHRIHHHHHHHRNKSAFKSISNSTVAPLSLETHNIIPPSPINKDLNVLIIGCGPVGLRLSIECALLGLRCTVVEKRDRFSRNNVLHLWPFTINDLKSLGAKLFYGQFCAGSIDHISIRKLQCILLKVALLMGVQVHFNTSFEEVLEPSSASSGWHVRVLPESSPLTQRHFDVIIGADGRRNSLPGFNRKEFRGRLAIGITANFVNYHSSEEAEVQERQGVAFIFDQKFFIDLREETGIDLENIVYYKDDTHYFVMTAKRQSLIDKHVLKRGDFADAAQLLAKENVNFEALCAYAKEAAYVSTSKKLRRLDFAKNHYGQPDVAMFDFTSLFQAENASRIVQRHGHRLLMSLVGDSLLEPFWPTGTGIARGFLAALDTAWMIRGFAIGQRQPLELLKERESIYQLLSQTTHDNLNKNYTEYTIDPASRYVNLNSSKSCQEAQIRNLFDTSTRPLNNGSGDIIMRTKTTTNEKQQLLHWCQMVVQPYNLQIENLETSWSNGLAFCAILHRFRSDLIDYAQQVKQGNGLVTVRRVFDVMRHQLGLNVECTPEEFLKTGSSTQSLTVLLILDKLYLMFKGKDLNSYVEVDEAAEAAAAASASVVSNKRKISIKNENEEEEEDDDDDNSDDSDSSNFDEKKRTTRRKRGFNSEKRNSLKHINVNDIANTLKQKLEPAATITKEERLRTIANENNPKSFHLNQQKDSSICYICSRKVYLMERQNILDVFMHANCFKCTYCLRQLKPAFYSYLRDPLISKYVFYCTNHVGMINMHRQLLLGTNNNIPNSNNSMISRKRHFELTYNNNNINNKIEMNSRNHNNGISNNLPMRINSFTGVLNNNDDRRYSTNNSTNKVSSGFEMWKKSSGSELERVHHSRSHTYLNREEEEEEEEEEEGEEVVEEDNQHEKVNLSEKYKKYLLDKDLVNNGKTPERAEYESFHEFQQDDDDDDDDEEYLVDDFDDVEEDEETEDEHYQTTEEEFNISSKNHSGKKVLPPPLPIPPIVQKEDDIEMNKFEDVIPKFSVLADKKTRYLQLDELFRRTEQDIKQMTEKSISNSNNNNKCRDQVQPISFYLNYPTSPPLSSTNLLTNNKKQFDNRLKLFNEEEKDEKEEEWNKAELEERQKKRTKDIYNKYLKNHNEDKTKMKCQKCHLTVGTRKEYIRLKRQCYHRDCIRCFVCTRQINNAEIFSRRTLTDSVHFYCMLHIPDDYEQSTETSIMIGSVDFDENEYEDDYSDEEEEEENSITSEEEEEEESDSSSSTPIECGTSHQNVILLNEEYINRRKKAEQENKLLPSNEDIEITRSYWSNNNKTETKEEEKDPMTDLKKIDLMRQRALEKAKLKSDEELGLSPACLLIKKGFCSKEQKKTEMMKINEDQEKEEIRSLKFNRFTIDNKYKTKDDESDIDEEDIKYVQELEIDNNIIKQISSAFSNINFEKEDELDSTVIIEKSAKEDEKSPAPLAQCELENFDLEMATGLPPPPPIPLYSPPMRPPNSESSINKHSLKSNLKLKLSKLLSTTERSSEAVKSPVNLSSPPPTFSVTLLNSNSIIKKLSVSAEQKSSSSSIFKNMLSTTSFIDNNRNKLEEESKKKLIIPDFRIKSKKIFNSNSSSSSSTSSSTPESSSTTSKKEYDEEEEDDEEDEQEDDENENNEESNKFNALTNSPSLTRSKRLLKLNTKQRQKKEEKKMEKDRHNERLRMSQDIQLDLGLIETKLQHLEHHGVELEKIICSISTSPEKKIKEMKQKRRNKEEEEEEENKSKNSSSEKMETKEKLEQELFNLIHEKNLLTRLENELNIKSRALAIDDKLSECRQKLRNTINIPETEKSIEIMESEKKIMEKIVDLVEEKNKLVEQLESLRLMEQAEDNNGIMDMLSHKNLGYNKLINKYEVYRDII